MLGCLVDCIVVVRQATTANAGPTAPSFSFPHQLPTPQLKTPNTQTKPTPPPPQQVAAYCDGRDTVSEYDCLLLEHVLWQEPEHAPKIADWLLAQLAVDDGMKQVGVCVWMCVCDSVCYQ